MDKFIEIFGSDNKRIIINIKDIYYIGYDYDIQHWTVHLRQEPKYDDKYNNAFILLISRNEYNRLANLLIRKD